MARNKRPKSFEANVQPLAAKIIELANENMNKSWKAFWKRRRNKEAEQSKRREQAVRQKSMEEKKNARRQKTLESDNEERNSLKRKSLGGTNELLFKAWLAFWSRRTKYPQRKNGTKAKAESLKTSK